MFDAKYYEDKKKSLQDRLSKKKDGLINDIISSLQSFIDDQKVIQEEYVEVIKREKENKEEPKKKKKGK